VVGIVLSTALGLLGCGGGGTSAGPPQPVPRPGALREETLRTTVSELKAQGAPASEISCVKRNIEALSEKQLAELILNAVSAERLEVESEGEKLGPLGKGCF
jgi:hypothetical protein